MRISRKNYSSLLIEENLKNIKKFLVYEVFNIDTHCSIAIPQPPQALAPLPSQQQPFGIQ